MVAIKAGDRDSFLARIPNDIQVVIAYGTDPGLVAETARTAATKLAQRPPGDGEVLRIEDPDLEDDPDRLFVELQTLPMFGGTKVIRTVTGRRVNANMLKDAIEKAPPAAALVVEAGNLKPSDTLRKVAEKAAWCAAVACFADTAQDLGRLVDEMLAAAGKRIDREARDLLISRLGSDRALSRSEIDKLILSVGERETLNEDDVLNAVGDVSELSLDRIVLAVADGDARSAVDALERATAGGQAHQSALMAVQRHYLLLHKLRAGVDGGRRIDELLRGVRPPVHFKMRDALARQVRAWPLNALNAGLVRLGLVLQGTRGGRLSDLEQSATERLLIDLARLRPRSR